MESWLTRIARKCCLFSHASLFKLIFLQFYLLLSSIKASIDTFLLEADYSFLNFMKFFFYIGIGVLLNKKCQKCVYHWDISIFQLILLENYRFEFFYQGVNWWWYIFRWLVHKTISDFVSHIEMLTGWTCEKVYSIFLFCRLSQFLIL